VGTVDSTVFSVDRFLPSWQNHVFAREMPPSPLTFPFRIMNLNPGKALILPKDVDQWDTMILLDSIPSRH
jgi:hypothetical protein